MFIPNVMAAMADYKIAIERIQELFLAEELDTAPQDGHDENYAIKIENGEFLWETNAEEESKITPDTPKHESVDVVSTIRDINIAIPHGKLVAVIGRVGSGKSSLLQAVIGEMKRINGDVSCTGSVSFAPQKAWIQNNTVKNNIIFGLPEDNAKYINAVRDCSLEHDLEILQDGDQVLIMTPNLKRLKLENVGLI
jgi:ATP-binding cassette subfamily C (CFTR/MRP) protein 1